MAFVVLGIDTSGTACSVALARGDVMHHRSLEVGSAHAEHLLDMVRAVLDEAGLALSDCDAIAFAAGPGSFTGLRVAAAVTQGLAFGAGLQVAPVGTLEAIALSTQADAAEARQMLVVQDARMGEVYWTLLQRQDGDWVPRVPPSLASALELRERVAAICELPLAWGCGNGWAIHGAALDGVAATVLFRSGADAADVARLGQVACARGRLVDADAATPLYVRDRVALTTLERDAERDARRDPKPTLAATP